MRRRLPSETDTAFTLVVEDQEQELYKDKVAPQPVQNIANRFYNFKNTIYNKSESFISTSILGATLNPVSAPPSAQSPAAAVQDDTFDLLTNNQEIEFVMTARDRSSEFANTIRSLQGRNINRAVNIRDPKKVKQIQNYGEFMMVAKTIGKNIASTYAKLEKLTLCEYGVNLSSSSILIYCLIKTFIVAKKKSIFDDRPAEIQELTYIIKGDLNSLNQQIGRLQEISKAQRRTSGKHLLSHSSNMVMALQTKLANMSSNFQQVLEVRTENLKQQKIRREQVSVV